MKQKAAVCTPLLPKISVNKVDVPSILTESSPDCISHFAPLPTKSLPVPKGELATAERVRAKLF